MQEKFVNSLERYVTWRKNILAIYVIRTIPLKSVFPELFAFLLVSLLVAFFLNIDNQTGQALGNVIGGAVGALAAFYVAYWSLSAAERERQKERSFAAAALVNSAMDRFYDMRRVIDHLAFDSGQDISSKFFLVSPSETKLEPRQMKSELLAEFARQFIYEACELNEMDHWLRLSEASFLSARMAHSAAQLDIVPAKLAVAIAHMRVAAEAWQNIVAGYAFARRLANRDDGTLQEYELGAANLLKDIDSITSHLPTVET